MSITLDQVTKHYAGAPVVNDVSLDIGDGEFFVLLGPSGSGKSTLLRAIAGLSGIDHGRISLHGRDVTHVAARKRGVGLVFQNYALFRHMTVAENIEFALRVRHMRARARRQRRQELLRLVALEGLDERLPAQLSGGQQQRVAVARALAHKPEVLLLDEPFGALDAKIREELRRTIRQVQRELGITTVLVTHDQEEAFAMADRIGIMNLGRLLEMGAPHELYSRPATRFVATFLGAANLFLARRTPDGIQVGATTVAPAERAAGERENEVVAVVRPEEIEVAASRDDLSSGYLAGGVVDELLFTGALERLRLRLEEGAQAPLLAFGDGDAEAALIVTRTQHEQRGFEVRPGQSVAVGVRRVHVLPTPLSSFTACAPSAELAQRLSRQPLLDRARRAHEDPHCHAHRAAARSRRYALPGRRHVRRHDGDRRPIRRARSAPRGSCAAAPATCWCCRMRRAHRSGYSSTGSGKPRAAPRSPSPPASCATCRPKRCTSASSPDTPRGPRPRRACASCSMRVRRRRWRTDWRCAPSCTSATRSRNSRAASPRVPGRC